MDNPAFMQVSGLLNRWMTRGRRVERASSPVDGPYAVRSGPPVRHRPSTSPRWLSTAVHRHLGMEGLYNLRVG